MANMLDYMEENGSRTFEALPFTPVDNLIYSQLSYIGYENGQDILPCPVKQLPTDLNYGIIDKNRDLFSKAKQLPRYRESILLMYENDFSEKETLQFAAATFLLPDGTAYVAFRGTDSTFVGWKEDFMLSFATPVPAQRKARDYLERVSRVLCCPLRVGGHSKGGNLAVYAAAFCEKDAQEHILCVYTNDGPGFDEEVLQSSGYAAIRDRVERYIPESSLIGMLMEQDSACTVIDSVNFGLFQHNPYSWKTEGTGFVTRPRATVTGQLHDASLHLWLKSMDEEKRRFLTDTVFDVLGAGQARSMHDLSRDPLSLLSTAEAVTRLSEEDKNKLLALFKALGEAVKQGGKSVWADNLERFGETDAGRLLEKMEQFGSWLQNGNIQGDGKGILGEKLAELEKRLNRRSKGE